MGDWGYCARSCNPGGRCGPKRPYPSAQSHPLGVPRRYHEGRGAAPKAGPPSRHSRVTLGGFRNSGSVRVPSLRTTPHTWERSGEAGYPLPPTSHHGVRQGAMWLQDSTPSRGGLLPPCGLRGGSPMGGWRGVGTALGVGPDGREGWGGRHGRGHGHGLLAMNKCSIHSYSFSFPNRS